jgi:hypothetical protein
MVVPYLCFRFYIVNRPVLEEYVSQVKRGPHLLQFNLRATQDGLLLATRDFENTVITDTLSLHAFFMDFHHNTSLGSILEDDSVSSTSRAHIHSYLGKGGGLWLVDRPSICSFQIVHFTFTSTLHFCLNLIQPSTSTLFMCECGHGLDAYGTHFNSLHV